MAAPKGFFVGGKVTESNGEKSHPIGPSDTVPAMLTPGEFVINLKDAQKNLPLLEHINKGGEAEDIPTNSQAPNVEPIPENSSLTPPSLGADIAKQQSSFTNNQIPNTYNKKNNGLVKKESSSKKYSSPPLIFKKANRDTSSQMDYDTPTSWSNIEDLVDTGNDDDNFTNTNNNINNNLSNTKSFSPSNTSSISHKKLIKKNHPALNRQGLHQAFKAEQNNLSQNRESISETINAPSNSKDNDEMAFESLAREIYKRLRQELEVEKERQGSFLGRLSW